MGCAAFSDQRLEDALQAFSHAVTLSDQYHHYIHYECAAAHITRARWFLTEKNYPNALEDLDAAVFQDHGSVTALLLRAWLHRLGGNETGMQKDLAQIQRYHADDSVSLSNDWQSVPAYTRALASDAAWNAAILLPGFHMNDQPITVHDEALEALKDNDFSRAIALFRSHLKHPRAWRHYGDALMKKGDIALAKEALDTAVDQHKAWHIAYHRAAASHRLNRSLCYAAMGNILLAWQEASKAADIDKNWDVAKNLRDQYALEACS